MEYKVLLKFAVVNYKLLAKSLHLPPWDPVGWVTNLSSIAPRGILENEGEIKGRKGEK